MTVSRSHPSLLHIDRYLAHSLHRVSVEVNVGLGCNLGDLAHWLQHTGFIVGQDDADQLRLRTQRSPHIVRIDHRATIHRQIGYRAAHLFEALAGVQHGVVFHCRGDDVVARLHQAEQSQVVAFGAAAGEDDLRRTAVQQLGDLLTRLLDGRARLLSLLMNGGRVAKLLEEVGAHRLKHLGRERRSGVVIEIDAMHNSRQ